jgi:hypothetical protein
MNTKIAAENVPAPRSMVKDASLKYPILTLVGSGLADKVIPTTCQVTGGNLTCKYQDVAGNFVICPSTGGDDVLAIIKGSHRDSNCISLQLRVVAI